MAVRTPIIYRGQIIRARDVVNPQRRRHGRVGGTGGSVARAARWHGRLARESQRRPAAGLAGAGRACDSSAGRRCHCGIDRDAGVPPARTPAILAGQPFEKWAIRARRPKYAQARDACVT